MNNITRRRALKAVVGAGIAASSGQLGNHAQAAEPDEDGSVSLRDAIEVFNAKSQLSPIGREQPPLTEEEVVAAIRWTGPKDFPVTAEEYAAFRQIAETRRLPAGAEFEVLTGFEPNEEFVFEAWSVRIRMPRNAPEFKGWTYAFTIRERMVSSRRIGPEERKVIDKWQKKWKEQGGIASLDRAEYAFDRARAVEKDRARGEGK